MDIKKTSLNNLKAYDLVIAVFFLFLSVYNLIYKQYIPQYGLFIALNIFITLFTFALAYAEKNFKSKIWGLIHYLYIAPLILLTYKELYYLIKPVRQQDFDWLFIKIDHFIFGTDPTHVIFQIANPALTEILQIVYSIFYLLPIILVLVLIKNRRYHAADYAAFIIIYGFYLSYLGYFALPGIGPRFTLYKFENTKKELPGLFLAEPLREFTNMGESISEGTPNPADKVQRDVFPSGHTMITLIVMYLSVRLQSRSRYFLLPVGCLLIFATLYLRYHYFIDLVGGAVFMMFALYTGRFIFNWWQRKLGHEEFFWKIC